jgi:hypothetical protein
MLHEIFLSLSGYPSPLLSSKGTDGAHANTISILSPSEKALLSSLTHLSELHRSLLDDTARIASSHPSSVCQAVATAIKTIHLVRFQQKVLEVESGILRKDAGSVGAYNIVPLTAIVGEFSEWMRRMEWFRDVTLFIKQQDQGVTGRRAYCTGAQLIDELCRFLQTGYTDIEEVSSSLVKVAETAWLKQLSTWVLYGRLPAFGGADFLIQQEDEVKKTFKIKSDLVPAFVTRSTASSILFIGQSLNHIRIKGITTEHGAGSSTSPELSLLPAHLQQLSSLSFPITAPNLSKAIGAIRLSLSQTTLQRLLPLRKIQEILSLLRDYFLLGRGEFAMVLVAEADDKIRSRWRRADNLGYEKREGLGNVVVKEGEVSAVLARTWTALASYQGMADDEDEIFEIARDLITLAITKASSKSTSLMASTVPSVSSTPFSSLLFSVPVDLRLQIRSPIDLFLTSSDLSLYSSMNSYLLSIRRAHIRLSDLWKISSLRRDHPAPPAPPYGSSKSGRIITETLRKRAKERSVAVRRVWTTGSAALFFLGETGAYLQGEVVESSWTDFQSWLSGPSKTSPGKLEKVPPPSEDEDLWASAAAPAKETAATSPHDPQTLALAHKTYLNHLVRSLLLNNAAYTTTLYNLLQSIDHLISLVHRLHSIWTALDLETDQGVVDAFSDFAQEQYDVLEQLRTISRRIKSGIGEVLARLRDIDARSGMDDVGFGVDGLEMGLGGEGEITYRPRRVGGVDRLLMKLDFGMWLADGEAVEDEVQVVLPPALGEDEEEL